MGKRPTGQVEVWGDLQVRLKFGEKTYRSVRLKFGGKDLQVSQVEVSGKRPTGQSKEPLNKT